MRNVVIACLVVALLLSACSTSAPDIEESVNATLTALVTPTKTLPPTPDQTATPSPTRTPRPTRTPDTRTDFEKCVEAAQVVKYVVTGDNVDAVSLTWQNDTGGTEQGDYKLPLCLRYGRFESGDFLYISAQIIRPTSGAGSIKCQIYDSREVISEAREWIRLHRHL